MLTTTKNALLLIKHWEGLRTQAYFDSVGVPTIGYGTTKYSNGDTVSIDDEITDDEAEQELFHYVRNKVEPVLTDHFSEGELQPNQRDALASFLYNLGGNPSAWPTLKKLINNRAPDDEIADQWLKYHKAAGIPLLGLYRRRIAEILVWLGMTHGAASVMASKAEFTDDWRKFAPDHPFAESDVIEDDLVIPDPPSRRVASDPTPATPLTQMDTQYNSAKAAGYTGTYADFEAHRTVITARNAIQAPNVDVTLPPKPLEDSKTVEGIAKKKSGQDDAWLGGIIGGSSVAVGTMSGLSRDISEITRNTVTIVGGVTVQQLFTVGLIIGGIMIAVGLWKMSRGETIAREGRSEAKQLKV